VLPKLMREDQLKGIKTTISQRIGGANSEYLESLTNACWHGKRMAKYGCAAVRSKIWYLVLTADGTTVL